LKKFDYFLALKKISLKIKSGSIFGIIGSNGAGKTTLIKILAGLMHPNEGSLTINDLSYVNESSAIKKNIGTITDNSYLYEELTIAENLEFYCKLFDCRGNQNFDKNQDLLLEKFDLSEWKNERIRVLSKGMKRKVELIRALIHDPNILLLDEPFSGLDFSSVKKLFELISSLNREQKKTVILTTHDIDTAIGLCDHLIILKKGKIVAEYEKEEFDKDSIKEKF
jgi:ABC-type multidrug transport system ATPase subunit